MDKTGVTRIPSIFDSDDDEEEEPLQNAPIKSPVLITSHAEEPTPVAVDKMSEDESGEDDSDDGMELGMCKDDTSGSTSKIVDGGNKDVHDTIDDKGSLGLDDDMGDMTSDDKNVSSIKELEERQCDADFGKDLKEEAEHNRKVIEEKMSDESEDDEKMTADDSGEVVADVEDIGKETKDDAGEEDESGNHDESAECIREQVAKHSNDIGKESPDFIREKVGDDNNGKESTKFITKVVRDNNKDHEKENADFIRKKVGDDDGGNESADFIRENAKEKESADIIREEFEGEDGDNEMESADIMRAEVGVDDNDEKEITKFIRKKVGDEDDDNEKESADVIRAEVRVDCGNDEKESTEVIRKKVGDGDDEKESTKFMRNKFGDGDDDGNVKETADFIREEVADDGDDIDEENEGTGEEVSEVDEDARDIGEVSDAEDIVSEDDHGIDLSSEEDEDTENEEDMDEGEDIRDDAEEIEGSLLNDSEDLKDDAEEIEGSVLNDSEDIVNDEDIADDDMSIGEDMEDDTEDIDMNDEGAVNVEEEEEDIADGSEEIDNDDDSEDTGDIADGSEDIRDTVDEENGEGDSIDVPDDAMDEEAIDSLDASNDDPKMDEVEKAEKVEDGKANENEDSENNSSDEDGSEGYIIDLNGSDGNKTSKLQAEKVDLDSSSSIERNLKVDYANEEVNDGEDSAEQVEIDKDSKETKDGSLKEKNAIEKEVTPSKLSVEVNDIQMQDSSEKNIQDSKEPVAPKQKIPLVRVPVRVEDVYTDSEEEATVVKDSKRGEAKEIDISSETTSVDPEDQKDVSLSSRADSVDPDVEALPSTSISATPTREDGKAKIWVSRSIFAPKKRGARKHQDSFNKEKCLIAFSKGWRREMVHRATVDPATVRKVRADVYYFAPCGKKLRSKVEIEDYLCRNHITDLSLENFSFMKDAVGGNESQEVIRHATKSAVGFAQRKKVNTDIKPSTSTSSPVRVEKRGRPRKHSAEPPAKRLKTLLQTPLPQDSDTDAAQGTTFKKILPSVVKPVVRNKVKVAAGLARPITSIVGAPVWKPTTSTHKPPTTTNKPSTTAPTTTSSTTIRPKYTVNRNHVVFTTRLCESPGIPGRILTPMLSEVARQQTFHCTGLCPLGGGTVPSLQCMKCLCLFHAKCTFMPPTTLPLIQSGGAKFLCPNCYKEKRKKASNGKYNPPTPYEPLVQDPSSSSTSEDDENDSEEVVDPKEFPSYVKVILQPSSIPTPPSSPVQQKADDYNENQIKSLAAPVVSSYPGLTGSTTLNSVAQGVPTNIPPDSIIHPMGSDEAGSTNGSNIMGIPQGSQLLQIQTPGAGTPRFILVRPQQNNMNVQQVGPVRAVYFPNVNAQAPIMFSNAGPTPYSQQQIYTSPEGSVPPMQLYGNSSYPWAHQPGIPSTGFQSSTTQEKQKTPPLSHPPKAPVVEKKKDFFHDLSLSYRLLLRVFKYLTAKDLLVTSRVCVMWRDLSYSYCLWNTLRLRNICVRDWNLLALFLERRHTRNIDLRKMVFRLRPPSPLLEESSRIDSSEPLSPYSNRSNVDTPPRSRDNSPQKTPSPEKSKDGKLLSTDGKLLSTDGIANKKVNAKEVSLSPAKETFEGITEEAKSPGAKQSFDLKEIVSQDGSVETAKEEKDGIDANKDKNISTKDDIKKDLSQNLDDSHDTKDSSDTDEEPMEIDMNVPDKECEDHSEVLCVGKSKPQEDDTEMESKNEAEKGSHSTDHTDRQRTRTRSSSFGNISSPEKDACGENSDSETKEIEIWHHICEALGSVRCLRSVVLPPCMPEVLPLLLSNCKDLTSMTASDIISSSDVKFDPAYLMEAPKLKEIRIGSAQGLSLTTNFNFIKLPELRVLVIRGFAGKSWPYLGTNLTSLLLGPCHSFTHLTWNNIGSMTNLRALWLEDGGSINDVQICEALTRLHHLRRLCLFNFTVGIKLGQALKKLTRLERLFILQNSLDGVSMGIKNNNMLAVTEHLRFLDELVWSVSSQHIKVINGVDHMLIFSPKHKSYPSLSAKENTSDQWPLKLIESVVKRHLPMTRVRIMKLDPAAATRMALSTL